MRLKSNPWLLLFFALLSSGLHAGALEDGIAAFRASDYQRAHALWLPLAEEGDAQARYNLGLLYDRGLGVAQDYPTARRLYTAAALQGLADAQYNLGVLYYEGKGVFRSHQNAIGWWTRAAEQGHPAAQYNLGVFNAYGIAMERSPERALKLWESAAEKGYPKARAALARVLESGELGFARDPQRARYWRKRLEND